MLVKLLLFLNMSSGKPQTGMDDDEVRDFYLTLGYDILLLLFFIFHSRGIRFVVGIRHCLRAKFIAKQNSVRGVRVSFYFSLFDRHCCRTKIVAK